MELIEGIMKKIIFFLLVLSTNIFSQIFDDFQRSKLDTSTQDFGSFIRSDIDYDTLLTWVLSEGFAPIIPESVTTDSLITFDADAEMITGAYDRYFHSEILNGNFQGGSYTSVPNWTFTAGTTIRVVNGSMHFNANNGNVTSDAMPNISAGDTITVYIYVEFLSEETSSTLWIDMNGGSAQSTGGQYAPTKAWYRFLFENINDNQVRMYGGSTRARLYNVIVLKGDVTLNWLDNDNEFPTFAIDEDSTMILDNMYFNEAIITSNSTIVSELNPYTPANWQKTGVITDVGDYVEFAPSSSNYIRRPSLATADGSYYFMTISAKSTVANDVIIVYMGSGTAEGNSGYYYLVLGTTQKDYEVLVWDSGSTTIYIQGSSGTGTVTVYDISLGLHTQDSTYAITDVNNSIPILTETNQGYWVKAEYQKVDSNCTPIIKYDNQTVVFDSVTASMQTDSARIWGVVRDDNFYFDGVDDEINFTNVSFDSVEAYTIHFTVKTEIKSGSITHYLMGGNGGSWNSLVYVQTDPNDIYRLENNDGISAVFTASNAIGENTVTFTFVYDGQGKLKGYEQGLFTDDSSTSWNGELILGNIGNGYASNINLFKGDVCEIKIFDTDLTATQISNLYKGDTTGISSSLVLDFNGTDGNISDDTWTDESENNNHGTVSSATPIQPPYVEISLSEANSKLKLKEVSVILDQDLRTITRTPINQEISLDISEVGQKIGYIVINGTDTIGATWFVNEALEMEILIDTLDWDIVYNTTTTKYLVCRNKSLTDPIEITAWSGTIDPFTLESPIYQILPGATDSVGIRFSPPSDTTVTLEYMDIISNATDSPKRFYLKGQYITPTDSLVGGPPTDLIARHYNGSGILEFLDNTQTETGFIIERSTNGVSYSVIDSMNGSDAQPSHSYGKDNNIYNLLSYEDTTISLETTYFYRVQAYSDQGLSELSNVATMIVGTIYHVSNTGSNDSSGTSPSAAWFNIDKVISEMPNLGSGDNVLYKRGDQFGGSQYFSISADGVENGPVTFGAYGSGNLPVIECFSTADQGTQWEIMYTSYITGDHIRVTDLEVITHWYTNPFGAQKSTGIGVRGSDIEIDNIEGTSNLGTGIHEKKSSGGIVASTKSNGGKNLNIHHNYIHDLIVAVEIQGNSDYTDAPTGEIHYNDFADCYELGNQGEGEPIRVVSGGNLDFNHNFIIHHNNLYDWGENAVDLNGTSKVIVEHNDMHHPKNIYLPEGSHQSTAIKIGSTLSGENIIRFNKIRDIRNSDPISNGGGIITDGTKSAEIYGNLFYNIDGQVLALNTMPSAPEAEDIFKFYYNTIYNVAILEYEPIVAWSANVPYLDARNNIIFSHSRPTYAINLNGSFNTSNNNISHKPHDLGSNTIIEPGGTANITNSIAEDIFLNISGLDFTLDSAGAAINFGQIIGLDGNSESIDNYDFFSNYRGTNPDAGFAEYGAGAYGTPTITSIGYLTNQDSIITFTTNYNSGNDPSTEVYFYAGYDTTGYTSNWIQLSTNGYSATQIDTFLADSTVYFIAKVVNDQGTDEFTWDSLIVGSSGCPTVAGNMYDAGSGGFESATLESWELWSGSSCTIAVSSTSAYQGQYGLGIDLSASNGQWPNNSVGKLFMRDDKELNSDLTELVSYTITFWARMTGTGSCQIRAMRETGGGSDLDITGNLTTTWTEYTLTFTVPAGHSSVILTGNSFDSDNGRIDIDCISIAEN